MIHIYEFDEYRNVKSDTRTKRLNVDIFLDILKKECKNYSSKINWLNEIFEII